MSLGGRAETPPLLIGRDAVSARLVAQLERRVPTAVVGEAGVGKTALLRVAAAASGRPVFEGHCFATLMWMSYLPVAGVLEGVDRDGDAAQAAAKVERNVGSGVLLLDDLQWCDHATRSLLPLLVGRVALLAAVRQADPRSNAVVEELAEVGFDIVPLEPLRNDAATALVRELEPQLTPARVDQVVRRSGGNPLLIEELARTGEPSPSLRLALEARLRMLTPLGREAFAALALVGHPVGSERVAGAGRELAAAGLVRSEGDEVAVRHVLLGETAVASLSASDLVAGHELASRWVEADGEVARHKAAAGEVDAAYGFALRAARCAVQPGERASHLALAAACRPAGDSEELLMEAAEALIEAGDMKAADGLLERVGGDDVETRARVALLRSRTRWETGDNDGARSALDEGLRLTTGSATDTEVFLHIERTRLVLFVDADYERGLTLAREALVLAGSRGVGEPKAELLVGTALALAGHPGSEQHLRMAWTLARAVADHDVEFRAANNLVATHENSGDPRLGRVIAAEAAVRARELGMTAWERQLRAMVANLDMLAGNYAEALDETERLLSEAVEPRTRDQLLVTRCLSLVDVGRLNEAREQIERAATTAAGDAAGRHQFTYLLAEVQFWTGRLRRAVAALDRFLAEVDDSFEIAMFARLARARAQAELGLSPDAVTVLHPIRFFAAVPVESEALRRLVAGDHDDAGAGFDEAARLWAPYHLRDSLYCTWMAGESLRRSEDSATACDRFEAVEAVGVPRGMEPLVARARRSLRLCGRRRSAARRAGVGTLTGRELDVLRLVRTGSTNDEIAARLGLSRRTVETQVASATRKLGVNSRLQAAARVEEP